MGFEFLGEAIVKGEQERDGEARGDDLENRELNGEVYG